VAVLSEVKRSFICYGSGDGEFSNEMLVLHLMMMMMMMMMMMFITPG
jgi:hypothetical protein